MKNKIKRMAAGEGRCFSFFVFSPGLAINSLHKSEGGGGEGKGRKHRKHKGRKAAKKSKK